MIKERSAGAIVFRREGNQIKYLLLHYKFKTEYWGFTKGNVEEGETELETAKREIREETGIADLNFLSGFKEKIHYFYRRDGELVSKSVTFFLAETSSKDVKISSEHIGYEWVDFKTALSRLKPGTKKVLEKANRFLKSIQ